MAKLKMTLLTPTLLLLCLGIGVRAGYYPSWLIKIAPVNRANVVFYGDSLAQQNGLVNVGQVSKMISLLWVTIFYQETTNKISSIIFNMKRYLSANPAHYSQIPVPLIEACVLKLIYPQLALAIEQVCSLDFSCSLRLII